MIKKGKHKTRDSAYWAIMKECYEKAEPSINIQDIIDSGEGFERDWYMKYYLDRDVMKEIITRHINNSPVPKHRRKGCINWMFLEVSRTVWNRQK